MHIPIYVHLVFLRSAALIALIGNSLLLLFLYQRTSVHLGNYRFILGSFAVADIFISLFHAWHIPIFILGEYGYVFFGYGTLRKKTFLAHNANIIYTTTFYLPFCLLSLHFIYRYFSLARPKLVKERFPVFVIVSLIYTVLYETANALLTHIVRARGVRLRFHGLLAAYGVCNWSDDLNVVAANMLDDNSQANFELLAVMLVASVLGGHTVVVLLICIAKISAAFKDRILDIRVRRMHVHLFRALLIQFIIPVLFSLIPLTAMFTLPTTGIYIGELGNVFSMLASVYPALDPILIIAFRQTLQRWVYVLSGRTAT
ncbi:hypothetical protein PENTCL1PPCAC_10272 [Pristionchus entomophagus]|uniref:G-protein coupled receptors family 1 profile domain-containing protein n=1 Tax=Pristionchus entomophagus TaxID=358040 RepID=A0AAV5T0N1_9BILA|nr:hypothetical protein PENTCL1PPCAC_10272 [Pristionchus entomophagus]